MPIIGSGTGTGTQPTTFFDLYTDLMNRVRVTPGSNATDTQAKRYINTALQDLHVGFDYVFPWCERRATLLTQAPYTTGTVSVSVGGTTVTGSSTAWNTNNNYGVKNMRAGGMIRFAGERDYYRVASVTSDTVAVIDTPYIGSSALSGAVYVYFEPEYALATDFLRPIDTHLFSNDAKIPYIGRQEFRRLAPRHHVSGRPTVCAINDLAFSGSTLPVRKVVFHPYPDAVYHIPYHYVSNVLAVSTDGVESYQLVGDSDEPVVPLRYRHVIVLHALYNWYRDKRDDARSQEVKAEYTDLVMRITSDQDIGTQVQAAIQPKAGYYSRHAYHPYSKRGGRRMDLNHDFDRFRR